MRGKQVEDRWHQPPPGFSTLRFERVEPALNARRFYQVSWAPTLFDDGAVVRTYGRKGRWKRVAITPFASLEAAWPLTPALAPKRSAGASVWAIIRTRLRHKYMITAVATD